MSAQVGGLQASGAKPTQERTAFVCPVCGGALYRTAGSLGCARGHSYDAARGGYVNLLQSQRSGARRHGDDARMVAARTRFLDAGYYDILLQALAARAVQYAPDGALTLLDAGCGEGRYTARVCAALRAAQHACTGVGVDLSRTALAAAHRRDPALQLAVGSVFHLPVAAHSCQLLLNVFAPCAPAEYARVLRRRGVLLRAIPLERHLWELKQAVYERPYENKVEPFALEGFTLLEAAPVRGKIFLPTAQTIQDLFCMTPYYYKTGVQDQQKLQALQQLTVTLEFGVLVYRKK